MYCFFNGEIVLQSDAKVSIADIGLLRGFGLYEGIPVFRGEPFRFADHWQRFTDGAHTLGMNIPITEEKAEKVIKELVEKNGYNDRANVRMILTGGPIVGGIEYNFETPTFYIICEKFEPISEANYKEGGKLITYDFKRDLPEFKTTNYIRAVMLQQFRKEEGAIEILFTKDGEVFECSTSNIFLVKDGKIITPAEEILKGITRKAVLEIGSESYEVEERRVYASEIATADEIFITSSFKDIVPIVKVDDRVVGDSRPGIVTMDLFDKYKKIIGV